MIVKTRDSLKKHPYYLANKKKQFRSSTEFGNYCIDYGRTYMSIYGGFADMYGRIPVYLKPKFYESINERVYKQFGFR